MASGTSDPVGSTVVTTEVWPSGIVVVYTIVVDQLLQYIPELVGTCPPETVEMGSGNDTDGISVADPVGKAPPGIQTENEHGTGSV
jgi:hypothetical protein